MDTVLQDLRSSVRALRNNLGYTVMAVLMLALGIGANTAIFTVINSLLLRPLPFKEPQRLVAIWSSDARRGQSKDWVSYPDLADWRAASSGFESFAAWYLRDDFTLTGGAEALRVRGAVVSPELFGLLDVLPETGRTFLSEDYNPGSRVALISHGLWQHRFNSDPNILGQAVTINGQSFTIIGVMPSGFQFPMTADPVEFWTSEGWDPASRFFLHRGARLLEVVGRLKAGVTIEQAEQEMAGVARSLSQQYPDTNKHFGVMLLTVTDNLFGDLRRALMILLGAVGCVLLIACANVANLLLARAATRRREMAVRAALGATRWRIIRQLLTESALLALAGGVCGGLLAVWTLDGLLAIVPGNILRIREISLDGLALGFTLIISLITCLVFGLFPALHASKTDLTASLKEGGRSATDGAGGRRLRNALVIAEVAIALVLLVASGLLVNSFLRLRQVNPGFDASNLLTLRLSLPYEQYDEVRSASFYRRLQERLQAIPGVLAASAVMPLPLSGDPVFDSIEFTFGIEGRELAPSERPRCSSRTIQPDYFRSMSIRLIAGRDFTENDDSDAPPVAIINETLARHYFAGEDPIGKRISLSILMGDWKSPMLEIVGVATDVKHRHPGADVRPEIYTPHSQGPFPELFIVLKTDADPRSYVSAVRAEVRALDPDLPVYDVRTLDERLGSSIAQERFNTILIAIFAVLALLLTAGGLYGVMTCIVTQRTHEIGIRMALGASSRDVFKMVIGQGVRLALAGIIIGLVASSSLTGLINSLLFGVKATDPITLTFVSLMLAGVAAAACYIPARRATKLDPIIAMRD